MNAEKKAFARRGQISMEFVIFIAIGLLMMLSFLYIINERESQIRNKQQLIMLEDLAYRIQSELDTASIVEDGYNRNFTIPPTLDGLNYNASIINATLIISSSKFNVYSSVQPISNSSGSINKGLNSIRKECGVICLNMPSCPCP